MAVTITRTAWTDDDGSGTTGTVINNAAKTSIYDQIDAALAALGLGINTIATVGTITSGVWNAGAVTSSGLITSTAFGAHLFNAGGTGGQSVVIRNTTNGAGNYAELGLGDAGGQIANLTFYSATFTTSGPAVQSGLSLVGQGAGGISISAAGAAGAIRFYSGGTTLHANLSPAGSLWVKSTTAGGDDIKFGVSSSVAGGVTPVLFDNSDGGSGSASIVLFQRAGVTVGSISSTDTTTIYNTLSDQRLKTDQGIASDLLRLRSLKIHDFEWLGSGVKDRGVFAQEAYAFYPLAVSRGTGGRNAEGQLIKPWQVDYSKFVPDLIVGWQQHDARLKALETIPSYPWQWRTDTDARLVALEERMH